jgi:hypothetical protein
MTNNYSHQSTITHNVTDTLIINKQLLDNGEVNFF